MEQSLVDTNNQQERQVDIAWLAGIWEGEGTISIVTGSKNRWFPRVSMINTDMVLIEEVVKVLNKIGVGHYVQLRKNGCDGDPKHKHAKQIMVVGVKRVQRFLDEVLPYIRGNKRLVGDEVQAYISRRLERGSKPRYDADDFESIKRIRALNQKGPLESSETIRWPLPQMASEDIVQVA